MIDDSANFQGKPEKNNAGDAVGKYTGTIEQRDALSEDFITAGEIRNGIIASISPNQIIVSIGAKSAGVISHRELEQLSNEEREALRVGGEVQVYIVNPEDANGNVLLSIKRAQEQISWENVDKLLESNSVIDSKIIGFNKGGLIVTVEGLRGFVPSSQISALRRTEVTGDTAEQRWQKMVGQPITVRVIEVDRERRRLILSERAASTESRQSIKERVIEELEEGKVYTGRVTSLANFGAFININGADGLVHLAELSWDHIEHPREVLEVGQEVKVKVINVDKEKKRIGLSVRALQEDPWHARVKKYSIGQLVEGVITRLTKFGAFARLEGDIEGLIHVSDVSEKRIEHPNEVLKEGEVKTLRIVRIDPEHHRIGLSLRKVDSVAFEDRDFELVAANFDTLVQDKVAEENLPNPLNKQQSHPQKNVKELSSLKIEQALLTNTESQEDTTTSFQLSRISGTVRSDAILTPTYLEKTVMPYVKAIVELQHIINAVKGRPLKEVRILKISQNSPIETVLGSAVDAISSAKEDIIPWRRKHAQQMATLTEQEKTVTIEKERAEILSSRATAAKDRAEEKKIHAEIEKLRAETERMELENEKLRWELQQSKIQLGLDILLKIDANLSETQRITFLFRLLEPLNVLTSNELEILISE